MRCATTGSRLSSAADLETIRWQLPAVWRYAYFNADTCGPMPLACAEAIVQWTLDEVTTGQIEPGRRQRVADPKERARGARD